MFRIFPVAKIKASLVFLCRLSVNHRPRCGQNEVRDVIKEYRAIKWQLNLLNKQVSKLEEDVAILKDHGECKETRLDEHHERLGALEEKLQEAAESRSEEIEKILGRLVTFEAQISIRLQMLEEKVDLLEQTQTVTAHEMELLKHSHTKTADEVELLKQSHTETVAKVDQLDQRCRAVEEIGQELKSLKTQNEKLGKLSV